MIEKQRTEFQLIRCDIDDIHSIINLITLNESAGVLFLAILPTICFVVEESHKYLVSQRLIQKDLFLKSNYEKVITKARVLLKLFDDSEGGKDGVVNALSIYQKASKFWMNIGKTGVKGIFGKLLQPDIGVFYLEEDPIFMTIQGFLAVGKIQSEVAMLQKNDFALFPKQSKEFGIAIGEYFNALEYYFDLCGIHSITSNNGNPLINCDITQNDFRSRKLYKRIAEQVNLKNTNLSSSLLLILNQVNIAYSLLPRVLKEDSTLLLRIQFLTAYHASNSLLQLSNSNEVAFSKLNLRDNSITKIPNAKKVRNTFAHYGLEKTSGIDFSKNEILDSTIRNMSGFSKADIAHLVFDQLMVIYIWGHENVSKAYLKKASSIFGDNT